MGVSQTTGLVFVLVESVSALGVAMRESNVATADVAIEISGKVAAVDIVLTVCATEGTSVVSFWNVGTTRNGCVQSSG